jgi:hypothetical protein
MDNQFTGLFIRAEIMQCSKLKLAEKLLVALIDSLDNSDKGCYASNKYLADVLQFSEQTVANMVYSLRKKGALQNTFFDGKNRGLRVFVPCSGNMLTPQSKDMVTQESNHTDMLTQESKDNLTLQSKHPDKLTQISKDKVTPQSKHNNKLTQMSNEAYSNEERSLLSGVTDSILYNSNNKEIYSEIKKSEAIDDTDWMQVAQAMIEYAKGEGKSQWSFMAGMYNYQEEPDKLISLWCSKAQPYDLKNWKKNFRNLTTWIKNEAQNTFRSAQATEKKDEKPVRDCGYPIYDPKTMKGLRVDCLKMEIDGLPWYVDCDYKPICIVEEWRHRYEL